MSWGNTNSVMYHSSTVRSWILASKLVTTPKLCPAPRIAHQRSGCDVLDTVTVRPSASTTSIEMSMSTISP